MRSFAARTSLFTAALTVAPLLCAGCAHRPPARQAATGGELAPLVDEYFAAKMAFEPSTATAMGLHEHDGALEDRSAARIAARVADLRRFEGRLAALDRGRLSFDEAIDAEVLLNQARAELLDLDTLAVYQRNPMVYAGLPGGAADALIKR